MQFMIWIWLAITAITAVVEFLTVEMVSVWFTVGGLFAMVTYAAGAPYWAQLIVFFVVSVVCLFAFRKLAMKWLVRHIKGETNCDALIGKNVKLVDPIDEDGIGSAKINDVIWTVLGKDNIRADAGSYVKVVEIQGNKLIVTLTDEVTENTNNKE